MIRHNGEAIIQTVDDNLHGPPATLLPPKWTELSACKNDPDPDGYFEPDKASFKITNFCGRCPVKTECSNHRNDSDGVWGGKWYDPLPEDVPLNPVPDAPPEWAEMASKRSSVEIPCLKCGKVRKLWAYKVKQLKGAYCVDCMNATRGEVMHRRLTSRTKSMLALLDSGATIGEVAQTYGVSRDAVMQARRRRDRAAEKVG